MQRPRAFVCALALGLFASACSLPLPVAPLVPQSGTPLLGINVGPERYTPDVLDRLAQLRKLTVLRTAVHSQAEAQHLLDALQPYPTLSVLLLVETVNLPLVTALRPLASQGKVHGIELGNELELQGLDPYAYANFICDAVAALSTENGNVVGFQKEIVSGGIYTVDDHQPQDFRTYLRPMLDGCGTAITVGLHWYGDTSDAWLAQAQALQRPLAVTEFGMPSRTSAEDTAQLAYLSEKIAAFTRLGASEVYIYQLISGPSASNLDNYGLWRADTSEKPALALLR